MDSGTSQNFLTDLMLNGLCSRSNEHGILDSGSGNVISKYHPVLNRSNPVPFDTFAAGTIIRFDASYPWQLINLPGPSVVANGSQLWCANCSAMCNGAGNGQECTKVNGSWTH